MVSWQRNLQSEDRPRLLLHIGLAKTGTTSIQQFCIANRSELLRQGILYANTGLLGPAHHFIALSFMSDAKRNTTVGKAATDLDSQGPLASLKSELQQCHSRPSKLLLSSERFSALVGAELIDLKNGFRDFKVQVIIYLRRQDILAESLLAQAYRVRSNFITRDKILTSQCLTRFDFDQLTGDWSNTFGHENLTVRRFEKGQDPKELSCDFLVAINAQEGFRNFEGFQVNRRLGRDVLEYLYHHTDVVFGSKVYFKIERKLIEYSELHPTPAEFRNFYSPRERLQLLERHDRGNRKVARDFFGNDELFSGPHPRLDEPWETYPGLSSRVRQDIEDFVHTGNR